MPQPSFVLSPPIKQNRIKGPRQPFEFVSAPLSSADREAIEQFIHAGFVRSYEADVQSFLPLLLGIKTQQIRAAVGVRRATSSLFIEQYLTADITALLAQQNIFLERTEIAEMGNLYSQSHRFTLPLIITVVMALYLTGVQQLIFSGTEKVRQLLSTLGFPMRYLADATPEKLSLHSSDWGSYYDHQPQVMALDIEASIKVAFQQSSLHDVLSLAQCHAQSLLPDLRSL